MWWKEHDFSPQSHVDPFLRIEELGSCVLDSAIGGGDVHFLFLGAVGERCAEREEIEVHLSREAFGEVGGGEPAGEGD